MTHLDNARRTAAEYLREATGSDLPEWRPAYDVHEAGDVDEPNAIAPVCPAEDHERADGSVYDCCPEPVIAVDPPLVAYLLALLNADRTEGAS